MAPIPDRPGQDAARGGKLRSMLSDSFYVALGSYADHFFSLLINLILVRRLSLENYGVYSVLLSTYAMGTLLLSLGAQPMVQRYLPEMLARRDRRAAIKLEWLGALIHLGAGLGIGAACWIFRAPLSVWLNAPQFSELLPYFALFTLLKFEAAVLEEMLTAHRAQKYRNLVLAAFQALKFGLFLFALPQDGSAETVMLYLVLSNLLLMAVFAGRILGISRRLQDDGSAPMPWRRILRYGLLGYTTTLTLAGFFADIGAWFVAHYHDVEQAGLYRFATSTVTMLATLVPTHYLLAVLVPVYVKEYTLRKDPDQLIRVFRFFNKLVTAFLAPALVGSLVLATPIVREVFDPKFLPSVAAFRIFFAGMFIFYFCNTSSFLLLILEKPEITLYSRLFVIYNIVLNLLLIPRYGIEGAAFATGSAMGLGYILTYLMVKRIIAIRIPWAATLRTFAYSLLMGLAVWPFLGWIHSLATLMLAVLVGALVYVLPAWRFSVFDREERLRLNEAFRRRIFPV